MEHFAKIVTLQKMKFSIKDFFSKCDKIRRKLRNWSLLLKKSLIENLIFWAVFSVSTDYGRDEEFETSYCEWFLTYAVSIFLVLQRFFKNLFSHSNV